MCVDTEVHCVQEETEMIALKKERRMAGVWNLSGERDISIHSRMHNHVI